MNEKVSKTQHINTAVVPSSGRQADQTGWWATWWRIWQPHPGWQPTLATKFAHNQAYNQPTLNDYDEEW